ncbi:fused MFS/spermidine synthase [Tumebacillus sp. DT12]|uniref:Fused MFS/spermidine synthase n=1 Tax=Tumebacillus lacus TaxID=2995335 RepID=A0ABT3WZC8_9BACL|nr:fused MFS/spermidine synthase [Tumebacillus lacus]MCX7569078.1 fused MFS/spermidine synthase [Tumebacillus lacus]
MNGFVLLSALCGGIGTYWILRGRTIREHETESLHQTVHVERRGQVRYLRFDSRGWQGAMHLREPERLLFAYQQAFLLAVCVVPNLRTFLAIGVGTGTALGTMRRLFPTAQLHGVDIDGEVIRVAREYFHAPDDERIEYLAADGRRYLEDATAEFDLVFLDAYADDRIPPRLETIEFVRLLRSRLAEGGAVAVNVIGAVRGRESLYLRRVWRTYRDVFAHVVIIPTTPFPGEPQNMLLIAADAPLPDRQALWQRVSGSTHFNRHKRRLNRLAGRMLHDPPWDLAEVKPLTDEDMLLFRLRD